MENFIPKTCTICGTGLKPIGTARKNGKNFDDWKARMYHKKCFFEMGNVVIIPTAEIKNDEQNEIKPNQDIEPKTIYTPRYKEKRQKKYQENKEDLKEYHKKRYQEKKDQIREYQKQRYNHLKELIEIGKKNI